MSIELQIYDINCSKCGENISFKVNDIVGLPDDIKDECNSASEFAANETRNEYIGMVDPDDLPIHPQTVKELVQAINRGNTNEALLIAHRIADDLGAQHANAAQIGLFERDMSGDRHG